MYLIRHFFAVTKIMNFTLSTIRLFGRARSGAGSLAWQGHCLSLMERIPAMRMRNQGKK